MKYKARFEPAIYILFSTQEPQPLHVHHCCCRCMVPVIIHPFHRQTLETNPATVTVGNPAPPSIYTINLIRIFVQCHNDFDGIHYR